MINYADPNMMRNNITQALMQQGAPQPAGSIVPPAVGGAPPQGAAPQASPLPPPALGAGPFASSNLAPGTSPLGAPSPGAGVPQTPPDMTPGVIPNNAPPTVTPKLSPTLGNAVKPGGYGGIDPTILSQLTGVRT